MPTRLGIYIYTLRDWEVSWCWSGWQKLVVWVAPWHMPILWQQGLVFQADVKQMKFPDRSTITGRMIDGYLAQGVAMDDHAIHLLFSANRWECRCEHSLVEDHARLLLEKECNTILCTEKIWKKCFWVAHTWCWIGMHTRE